MTHTIITPTPLEELRSVLREWTKGPNTHHVGALADRLEAEQPELADAVIATHRRTMLVETIGKLLGTDRKMAARRFELDEAIEVRANGGLSVFATSYVIDPDNNRKLLGEMTGADCLYVASDYEQRALYMNVRAAQWRRLAKKVPKGKTVSDVLTEEQVSALVDTEGTN